MNKNLEYNDVSKSDILINKNFWKSFLIDSCLKIDKIIFLLTNYLSYLYTNPIKNIFCYF
jgi:hypothetical protein